VSAAKSCESGTVFSLPVIKELVTSENLRAIWTDQNQGRVNFQADV